MNPPQSSTDSNFPRPGATARAVFRCALFATIPVAAAFPVGWFAGVEPLYEAAALFLWPLSLFLFVLSCGFLLSEWRLALLGFFAAGLLFLAALAFPVITA